MAIIPWLEQRKFKIAIIVFGVGFVTYLGIETWLNRIHLIEKHMILHWSILKENCERRAQILPQFNQLIQYYAPQAESVRLMLLKAQTNAMKITLSEKSLSDPQMRQAFCVSQDEVVLSLLEMERQEEQLPALKQNRQYLMLKRELQSYEQQIEFSYRVIAHDITAYNNTLTSFPLNWLNAITFRYKTKALCPIHTLESNRDIHKHTR